MEIIRIYTQTMPKTRFIGKKYGDSDRVNGSFDAKWSETFDTGMFSVIENAAGKENFFEDCEAHIGLMRCKDSEPFQYWIGMFTKDDTPVPDGLEYVDFPASEIGIGWIYGNEDEIYGREADVAQKLMEEGHTITTDENGALWFFERYQCPRHTTPDEKGNIILDIVHFIER